MLILVVAFFLNYKYSLSQHYDKCISENTKSSFCDAKVKEVKASQLTLKNAEIPEQSSGN
jgi:hypothetical protein